MRKNCGEIANFTAFLVISPHTCIAKNVSRNDEKFTFIVPLTIEIFQFDVFISVARRTRQQSRKAPARCTGALLVLFILARNANGK
ncbi:uncharacterized protein CELE_K07C5.13 [Caenorhabditis elegans]|uniref:Secreted protein n=1 Tax=Caenorhabditis elegans TaxID=6239 RepID=A0A131MDB5_CAEEL|nr:Secreted protein [Caenorhabditis elegans]CZR14572.1 Secreted protein [Caenorhabditis elegans]|eukprot:NP_001309647.1 Uncharacterized protein CELE_K07C5.13 [Caenorhabditis elegans]